MHPFDVSLELEERLATATEARFMCRAPEGYRNAIGPFGGWIAALLLKAVLRMPGVRGAPLAMDAAFMGSIADADMEVRVLPVRQNRSVGFWQSQVWQADRVCAQAQVTVSVKREGARMQDAIFPDVPPPAAVAAYDNPRAPVPWLDQYVFKPVKGLLFSRAERMDSLVWIRDAEPRPLDVVSLTALCDTPFPPTWIRLGSAVPVSTVTYSIYYRADVEELAKAGSEFCLLESGSGLACNGYVDQFTRVWSATGALLAQTQQMLWLASG